MPHVPTFAEQGVANFRADLWHGLVAPKGVPADVIAKLNADINAVLRSPEMQSRLAADAVTAAGGMPQQFGEVIRADMEKWRAASSSRPTSSSTEAGARGSSRRNALALRGASPATRACAAAAIRG